MPKYMYGMLVFIPISFILKFSHADPKWVFLASAVAIMPLAAMLSLATEELAKHLGSTIGSLLNATFGNAAELILLVMALRAGELELIEASIIGSLVSNLLLFLGGAALVGGIKYKSLKFDGHSAGVHSTMLLLILAAMLTPSLFAISTPGGHVVAGSESFEMLSLCLSVVLILVYASSLVFSLKTHQHLFAGGDHDDHEPPHWSKAKAGLVLAAVTVSVALMSEILVESLDEAVADFHLSKVFLGIILMPILGNMGEAFTAVKMASRNRMGMAVDVCIGASTQIAFFVAPVLVLVAPLMGQELHYLFTPFEVIAVGFAAFITANVARDGEMNWLEGLQLFAFWAVLALTFFFVPG